MGKSGVFGKFKSCCPFARLYVCCTQFPCLPRPVCVCVCCGVVLFVVFVCVLCVCVCVCPCGPFSSACPWERGRIHSGAQCSVNGLAETPLCHRRAEANTRLCIQVDRIVV